MVRTRRRSTQARCKSAANSAIKTIRLLFNWAARRDDNLGRNPCRLSKNEWHAVLPKRNPITREKLAVFYQSVLQQPPMTRDYLLLLLFTSMRRREAAGLRWTDVDFERRLIRLPSVRVKNKHAIDLPMTDFVFDLLMAQRQLGNGDYVFPSYAENGHIHGADVKPLRKQTGLKFNLHDLRRTWAGVAASSSISFTDINYLLNHTLGNGVTEIYIQRSMEDLREAAQKVTDRLQALFVALRLKAAS
jgi:integrase